ncbi:hypothetical protein [Polaribacter glomeratus]|uniref:Uncharacterized protein n=1 Tax=Polaribacter glomeratus TaxID=102 RepID=A0A2S7WYC9_9FLAO|nr:hypothetical protein [Polaribacter glomeratus]PQJ82536.1 hypothetical protein BTO16_08095 [Polaribacter glomeratus]TXD65009.1 hypothetical protein ESX12_12775 [Polaribacter glomeratus]
MKSFIFLFLMLVFSSFIFSQETSDEFNSRLDVVGDLNGGNTGLWVRASSDVKIKGNYYLFDNWVNLAKIISGDGKKFNIKNINYDTKEQRFVTKISADSIFIFNVNTIKQINVNNTTFKLYEADKSFGYYELIAYGKGKEVLKKSVKTIKKGVKDPFTNSYKQDELVLKTQYFFNSKDGLKEIELKKKHFLKLFGDDASIIKKIISKNNLSTKKDEDLAKIFQIYKEL